MRKFAWSLICALPLCILVPSTMTGCAAAIPVLTKIAAVVMNAKIVLDIIDGGVREWFRTHPDTPDKVVKKYEALHKKALLALDAAAQIVAGSTDLSQDEYDAAFAEFKQAYIDLVNLLHKQGIARDGTMAAADGSTLELPEPLALTHRVE
jgi:hypothetical protein